MFIAIFCVLVILFLIISKVILWILFFPAAFCDVFFNNKFLRASGYVIWIASAIGLLIGSVILAYNLTPDVLEYIK